MKKNDVIKKARIAAEEAYNKAMKEVGVEEPEKVVEKLTSATQDEALLEAKRRELAQVTEDLKEDPKNKKLSKKINNLNQEIDDLEDKPCLNGRVTMKGFIDLAVVGIIALVAVGVIAINNGVIPATTEVVKKTLGY